MKNKIKVDAVSVAGYEDSRTVRMLYGVRWIYANVAPLLWANMFRVKYAVGFQGAVDGLTDREKMSLRRVAIQAFQNAEN